MIVAANAAWRLNSSIRPGPFAPAIGASFRDAAGSPDQSDNLAKLNAGLAAVMSSELPDFGMEYFVAENGSQGWFSLQLTPLCAGGPEVAISVIDITERKRHEERQRIAAIAFESPHGMLITDVKGRILQTNAAFTDITGYSSEEVLHRSPSMLSSGRHGPEFYREMWDCIRRDGRWEGEIWNRRKNGEIYPERLHIAAVRAPDGSVTHYVGSLSDITLSKAASDEIKSLAFFDPLTRLPNRRLLMDRLNQAIASTMRREQPAALMFLDLDNFKTLNDTLGHSVGDQLLEQVALRLLNCVRECDTVARLGGDEFVLILEGLGSDKFDAAAHARNIASNILATFSLSFELGTHQCHSSASIGITLFHKAEHDPEQLLMQGDIAMYGAKQSGRNSYCFFDLEMQEKIAARAQMDGEMRVALEQGQFELYYQLQVAYDGKPRGAEALIRWRKPDGSCISPAQFIPLAEENGLIIDIGDWILEQACVQLQSWARAPATASMDLAINVSARQFRHPDFAGNIISALARHSFDPARLKLELTEGVLLETPNEMIECMGALRATGIRFSLDDFGTGYSSLQYLKRLPLDQLKIDQSFVRELVTSTSDRAIVKTIIAMAHSLNLDVIAEGVETSAQRDLLYELRCMHYQGYFYGRPMPAADLFESSRTANEATA